MNRFAKATNSFKLGDVVIFMSVPTRILGIGALQSTGGLTLILAHTGPQA